MRRLFTYVSIVVILVVTPTWANPNIEWKKTTIEHTAQLEDDSVTALFHFANIGDSPLKILGTKSSCGCTVPELDKEEYAPGEIGTVKVKFTFEGRSGPQTKNVMVYTNVPSRPTSTLTLSVDIPPFLTPEPELLFWQSSENNIPKSTLIKNPNKKPIYITDVTADNEDYTYELARLEDGYIYRLTVTPKEPNRSSDGKITLTTDVGKEQKRRVMIGLKVY